MQTGNLYVSELSAARHIFHNYHFCRGNSNKRKTRIGIIRKGSGSYIYLDKKLDVCAGDVVFIPRGVHYHAEVLGGKNDRIDTYTLNLQLVSPEGEELLLSDEIAVIATRQDDLFAIRAAAVSGAVHRVGQPGTLKVQVLRQHLSRPIGKVGAGSSAGTSNASPQLMELT